MPWSCFGKKDKKADAADDSYNRSPEKEPLVTQTSAPATTQAPPPAQTEAAPATPPTPVTPSSTDARLRPEDDPDKASRRRDVVASFYSDECELIGFKATGSRPPSAVVGGTSENPAATSSPVNSLPSGSRVSALSRADLALKRREFFKDLAVNDLSSSRYGASQPSWRMMDSGSLTTPRRSHQDSGHHTLPAKARFGGVILRPISTPTKATSGPDLRIINGDSDDASYCIQDTSRSEAKLLLADGAPQESVGQPQDAPVAKEQILTRQRSEGDIPTPAVPATPPATPATPPPTPPARAETLVQDASHERPLASEALVELAATHFEGSSIVTSQGEMVVQQQQQQYVQQVSVGSDDERVAEGSSILITEAFPEQPRPHLDFSTQHIPDTIVTPATPTTLISPPTPPATHEAEAIQDVSQHSSEQATTPPTTEPPTQRESSLPEEREEENLLQHANQAALDLDQDAKGPTSSSESSTPGSPQELRQPSLVQDLATTPPLEQQFEPPNSQQEGDGEAKEERSTPTIVSCIPKPTPTQEPEFRCPSPPHTPPPDDPPITGKILPPAPPTSTDTNDRSPPSPPSLSEPRVTCGVEASSPSLEDDGLGSDIDEALGSLECLTEEGNSGKRPTTAST